MKGPTPTPGRPIAFTLIELLVVVTVIVVLLALLMPAMGRAIYQANLAKCGANLKLVGSGVLQYALENKRYYPDRGLKHRAANSTADWISAMALKVPHDQYDMRPGLRPYMSISKALQCPFSDVGIDLDTTPVDVGVEASYVMFWGWKYEVAGRTGANANQGTATQSGGVAYAGMYMMGDRLEWQEPGSSTTNVGTGQTTTRSSGSLDSYNVLAGDIDLQYAGDSHQASHPDRNPTKLGLVQAHDDVIFGSRARLSRFLERSMSRGILDTQFVFDDGSMRRYTDVKHVNSPPKDRHPDLGRLPVQFDQRRVGDWFQVPLK